MDKLHNILINTNFNDIILKEIKEKKYLVENSFNMSAAEFLDVYDIRLKIINDEIRKDRSSNKNDCILAKQLKNLIDSFRKLKGSEIRIQDIWFSEKFTCIIVFTDPDFNKMYGYLT